MGKRTPKKSKDKAPQAYDLNTPIVKAYLNYISTPEAFESGQKKHIDKFMADNAIKSYSSLSNYVEIKGFKEELTRRKADYVVQEQIKMLAIGKAGLFSVAVKHELKREVVDNKCNIQEIKEEVDPNVKACERLIQLGGGDIQDNINITGADAILQAAKMASNKADNS